MINQIIYHRIRGLPALRITIILTITVIGAILIAGCSGQPEATTAPTDAISDPVVTADTSESGEAPTPESGGLLITPEPDFTQPPFPTVRPTIEGELLALDSRTLVASRTEDPNAGEPFDLIRIERSGGPGSTLTTPPLVIEVQGNGALIYGDQQGQVSQAVMDQMNNRIRAIDYFGISGDFLGVMPLEGTEDYLYKLRITRGDLTRTLDVRDVLMPQELRDFIAYLMQETRRAATS